MDPEQGLARLHRGLRSALGEAGLSLKAASARLERFPEYVGRALSGRLDLKVPDLFVLLDGIGLHPMEFFDIYFPLGGEELTEMRWGGPEPPTDPATRARGNVTFHHAMRQASQHREPSEWAVRAGELLRQRIRRAGTTQRAVSVALGLSPDALGHCLRGDSQLPWRHVLGVLAEIRMTPARFFVELCFEDKGLAENLRWAELLDRFEEKLTGLSRSETQQLEKGGHSTGRFDLLAQRTKQEVGR